MESQRKCQLAVCGCRAQDGKLYCSDDCRQAASQGIQRDFCQCAHAGCEMPVYTVNAGKLDLPDSISSAPGWVTIEYSNFEDLRNQLLLLAQSLNNEREILSFRPEAGPRRGPLAEGISMQKAQSA